MKEMRITQTMAALLALSTCACSNYKISLNDNVVYTPPSLFSDYSVADTKLKECIRATISEARITKALQLKNLHCPNSGITSLAGLEAFSALEKLGMAHNDIDSLGSLDKLKKLTHLNLEHNRVEDIRPISGATALVYLNVKANPVSCAELSVSALQSLTKLESDCEVSL